MSRVLEVAPLLPLSVAWTRRNTIPHKFLPALYYVGAEVFFYMLDVVSRYVLHNNVYVFHLSTAVGVVLLTETYRRLFYSRTLLNAIKISLFLFLLVAIADATFLNGLFTDMNSYSQAFGSAMIITLSLLYIFKISYTDVDLESQPEFFFSIAVLIYFAYSIVTHVASNIIYNSGYDMATRINLDRLISAPDAFLYAVHMGLLAWMCSFFPLSINPLRALPRCLHYSRWHQRPYKVLGQSSVALHHLTAA